MCWFREGKLDPFLGGGEGGVCGFNMFYRADDNKGLFAVLKTIFNTIFHLPTRIGAVCRIWFYAWIGMEAPILTFNLSSHLKWHNQANILSLHR